jgi:hypothetical protein
LSQTSLQFQLTRRGGAGIPFPVPRVSMPRLQRLTAIQSP